MKKTQAGLIFGAIAGIIDVTPMIFQGLSWDANISAFCFWIISGFMIATSNLKLNSILKGIFISYLVLLPIVALIAWSEPVSLIPIGVMTLVLGGALGYIIDKF